MRGQISDASEPVLRTEPSVSCTGTQPALLLSQPSASSQFDGTHAVTAVLLLWGCMEKRE